MVYIIHSWIHIVSPHIACFLRGLINLERSIHKLILLDESRRNRGVLAKEPV